MTNKQSTIRRNCKNQRRLITFSFSSSGSRTGTSTKLHEWPRDLFVHKKKSWLYCSFRQQRFRRCMHSYRQTRLLRGYSSLWNTSKPPGSTTPHGHRRPGACTWKPYALTTTSRDGISVSIAAHQASHSYLSTCWSTFCTVRPGEQHFKSGWFQRESCVGFKRKNTGSCKPKSSDCGKTMKMVSVVKGNC